MEELVNLVSERVGLPADKARMAVEVVVSQLKSKAPPALSGQIDSLIGGGSGGLGGVAGGLGGLMGGEKK